MPDDQKFARLVSLACHDLRAPLAVIYGFGRTLSRTELVPPADRYVEMIEEASKQLSDLLDELGLVARIEAGRYEPRLAETDSLELARAAAAELDEGRVEVSGSGGPVNVPEDETRRALSQLARAATRHGGFESVQLAVDGPVLTFSPVTRASSPVLLGEEIRDLGALAATTLVRALGGSVETEDERLVVRLPT